MQFKGRCTVEIAASRGGSVFSVAEGDRLREGDAIRFSITVDRPGYLTVFSSDSDRTLSPFYPADALEDETPPLRISSAGRHVLPGSIVLDDSTGPERFIAVFSAEPFARSAVVPQSAAAVEDGNFDALGPSVWIQSIQVHKEAASGI